MTSFGPGLSEAERFIHELVQSHRLPDPNNIVIDTNICYASRPLPRIVKVFGEEHISIPTIHSAPLALMVFKMLRTNACITAYEGKKVVEQNQLIDDNGYIWSTSKLHRVVEYEKCNTCAACKLKGKWFDVNEQTEPHLYTLTRALDEIRETVPCPLRTDGYAVRLFRHFKDLLDKAFIVAAFGRMEQLDIELNIPFAAVALKKATLSCSDSSPGLEFVHRFCRVVTALLKEEETIANGSHENDPETMLAKMYKLAMEYGTEQAYSLLIAEYHGCTWWSTEEVSDENMYNVWKRRHLEEVQGLSIDWDCVNTAQLRRSYSQEPEHFAGRLDGTPISSTSPSQFGFVCLPQQPEYLQLDSGNELEVERVDGKKELLLVTENGALVATTRKRMFWKKFRTVVRGIGVSPVTLAFDFSALGPEDSGGTDVASRILTGQYEDKALRFLLQMTHKARLLVNRKSPCKSYLPEGCLSDHGVFLAVAMPVRAFQNLVFCCTETNGEVDTDNIYWKPSMDGDLFKLDKIAMNLTRMVETRNPIENLKICQMMMHNDIG